MENVFTIWVKKPKTYERVSATEDLPDTIKTITTITEHSLKSNDLKVPISPYANPRGLQKLAFDVDKSAYTVAMILITGLHSRKQNNIVETSIINLAAYSNMSVRTVNSSILTLVAAGYIRKEGKQSYYISPKLAWFGNQVDWAIALKNLQTI
jgi:hypothetical protein